MASGTFPSRTIFPIIAPLGELAAVISRASVFAEIVALTVPPGQFFGPAHFRFPFTGIVHPTEVANARISSLFLAAHPGGRAPLGGPAVDAEVAGEASVVAAAGGLPEFEVQDVTVRNPTQIVAMAVVHLVRKRPPMLG